MKRFTFSIAPFVFLPRFNKALKKIKQLVVITALLLTVLCEKAQAQGCLTGTYSVGVGGNFPTLTAAVTAYNTGCLAGAVTFELIQSTYTSTPEISISHNPSASAVNTLTIRPAAGVTPNISGSNTFMLKFNGADFVTIDGSNSGGTDRSLTIRNTNTGAGTVTIFVSSLGVGAGANNNTIKNCNISSGSLGIAIYAAGTTISPPGSGAENDNLTIQNNQLSKSIYGIYVSGTAANKTNGLSIISNTIGSVVTADRINQFGIRIAQVNNFTIAQNEILHIGNFTGGSEPTGILISSGSINGSILRNNIHDIICTATAAGGKGIDISSASSLTVANNFINNIKGPGWTSLSNSSTVGIRISGTSANVSLYFNTVILTGSISRTTSSDISAALSLSPGQTGLNIRNNILVNTLVNTTGTAKAYAIHFSAANPSTTYTSINQNDYYVAGPEGILGFFISDKTTLATWKTATLQDVNSVNVAPVFESAADLHLAAAVNPLLNGGGAPIAGVTNDYDGATRNATTPDIGADEGCDDGLFCNGVESYNPSTGCVAGTAPADDGIACTVDACDETNDQITHTANNSICDDGLFCNGAETCNSATGCIAGTAPATNDAIACTADACDETNNVITHTPNDALCNDGNPSTTDTCNPTTGCANITSAGIPTLSEWGLIILFLLTIAMSTVFMLSRQVVFAGGNSTVASSSSFFRQLPFDAQLYKRVLLVILPIAVAGFFVVHFLIGTNGALDFTGTIVSAGVVAYIAHLLAGRRV